MIFLQSAPPAAGGAAWSIAGSWNWSTNVANVDFTGLGSYNELMVMVKGLSLASTGFLSLSCSVDNGANFPSTSGTFIGISAAGGESNQSFAAFHSSSSAAARSGAIWIPHASINGIPKLCQGLPNADGRWFVGSLSPVNALRLTAGGSINFTAGSAWVLGR